MQHLGILRDSSERTPQPNSSFSDYILEVETQVVSLEPAHEWNSRDHIDYTVWDVHFYSLPHSNHHFSSSHSSALLLRAEIQYRISPYEEIGKKRLSALYRSLSWNYANKQSFSRCHKHSIISLWPFSPLQLSSVSASLINPYYQGLRPQSFEFMLSLVFRGPVQMSLKQHIELKYFATEKRQWNFFGCKLYFHS